MRPIAVSFFFVVTALSAAAIYLARRVQLRYGQPYLVPFSLYVVSWCGLTLLSIVQFVLGSAFLPGTSVEGAVSAGGPLFATLLATSLYFLSGFMAGLSGGRLSKAYTTVFLAACLPIAGMLVAGSGETAAKASVWRQAASFMLFLFKTLAIGGWCTFAWVRIGKMTDPLERQGRRGIVLSYLGGYVVFEGALRNVGSVVGLPSTDYAIAFLQLASVFPPLLYLDRFLCRRSMARPPAPPSPNCAQVLAEAGLSSRESEVVELVLTGLGHKEIGDRLGISAETVKKHTYNAYRKLGVQNRIQLSYVIQNRISRLEPDDPPSAGRFLGG